MLAQSRPNSRDLYWHQRNDRDLYYKRSCKIRPANATVVTSINLINVYVNIQTMNRQASRHHLAFAVANCALNPRFSAVTVGSCDGLLARPAIWRKMLFLFNCYFFRTTPTNRDLREKAVYFPPRWLPMSRLIIREAELGIRELE